MERTLETTYLSAPVVDGSIDWRSQQFHKTEKDARDHAITQTKEHT